MNVKSEPPEQSIDTPSTAPAKKLSIGRIFLHDIFEMIGILLLVLGGLVFAAFFYLHNKNVSLEPIKHIVEERLSNPAESLVVNIGNLDLAWPDLEKPLLLQASNITATKYGEEPFFSVSNASFELYFLDLILGRIALKSATLENPTIKLLHMGKHHYRLSMADIANPPIITETATNEIENDDAIKNDKQIINDFFHYFSTAPEKLPSAYRRTKEIALIDADIQLIDIKADKTLQPQAVNILIDRDETDIKATIKLGLDKEYGENAFITFSGDYDSLKQKGSLNLSFDKIDIPELLYDWIGVDSLEKIRGIFSGDANIGFTLSDGLKNINFSLTSDEAVFHEDKTVTLTMKPFLIEGKAEDRDEKGFNILVEKAVLGEGRNLSASVSFAPDPANIELHLKVPSIETDFIETIWPKPAADKETPLIYTWLVEKINNGTYKDVSASIILDGTLREDKPNLNTAYPWSYNWNFNEDKLKVEFGFKDIDVRYLDSLPQVEKSSGTGSLANDSMQLNIAAATLNKDIVLKEPAIFKFQDFMKVGAGHAETTLALKGPLSSVLSYLSNPPISIQERIEFEPADVKGDADFTVALKFPTVKDLKKEDVHIQVNGTVNNTTLPAVLGHLPLSDGPFTIDTDGREFKLSGKGYLGGTPIDLNWHQFLRAVEGDPYLRRIEAKTRASLPLQKIFGLDLTGFTSDEIPVDVVHVKKTESLASLDVNADLSPVALSINFFDYMKEKDKKAQLQFQADLLNEKIKSISNLSLEGPALYVIGKDLKFNDASTFLPQSGTFVPFDIGDTKSEIRLKPINDAVQIDVLATALDAGGFINQDKGGLKGLLPALIIRTKADKLYLKNGEFFEKSEFQFKQNKDGNISNIQLQGLSSGKPVSLSFNPDQPENPERLKFSSENAGATLRALGLYNDMRGGVISVAGTGRNPEKPEEIKGVMNITGFKVANAPLMAKFLSLLSVQGFFEGAGSGDTDINFDRLGAKFYTEKNAQDQWLVIFDDAKVKSSSLGLTFAGTTNIDEKTLNIKGEIIPVAGLNNLVNEIPVIGQVLTGGKDSALFAARYSIKGSDKDPEIRINPLSAITPGFLRGFLFGDEKK
ncbi:MAG: hypothetical protein CMH30_01275 [Micavibrio sp.]|nr:hypothetical protein [Micavibrio sp.]